ncbi:uncharacterized protein BX663DRAFT_549241 [Cokeromyces recurvatus]|uniref:uncharacterized protein n=1 Tax=Cokeromyces recurvatus TaxID=90255 RepID=UPI00221FAE98|nr:uncharacterized protein BX663DRAFT_549241 [Cokeromyces recurvatus]KAI7906136.1 hypothetical protein BX663DRAFT_549241 [Cokeromyces recurvatus]
MSLMPRKNSNNMCKRTTCSNCNKATWIGCGRHVEEVLDDVPKDERCQCPGIFARIKAALGF